MNGKDGVELLKNSAASNTEDWLKRTEIITYAVVTKVLGNGIVQVQQVVRTGLAKRTMIIPIMSTASSLFEAGIDPTVGDLVLVLFLNRFNRSMFDAPTPRFNATDDWTIFDEDAVGYGRFAGIGLLLAPIKGLADTLMKISRNADGTSLMTLTMKSQVEAIIRREVSILFDSIPGSGGFVDRVVKMTFGQHSPHLVNHWAAVTRLYGFAVKADNTLDTVTAPVIEKYSTMAPITKQINGVQSITIGIAQSPEGGNTGTVNTAAKITVRMGSNAEIDFQSLSKAEFIFGGPLQLTLSTADKIKFGNTLDTIGTLLDAICAELATVPSCVGSGVTINPAFASALAAIRARANAVYT